MKRFLPLTAMALLALSLFALASCDEDSSTDLSDSKYVGTWKATMLSLAEESEELEGEWLLILNGDGTGQFTDDKRADEITWAPTDDGFKTRGDVKLTFKDDGDNIKTSIVGVDLTFEKQA